VGDAAKLFRVIKFIHISVINQTFITVILKCANGANGANEAQMAQMLLKSANAFALGY
jgi:hypothetical protein